MSASCSELPVFALFDMLTGRGGKTPPTRPRIEFMVRIAALIVVIGATLAASPVAAQFWQPFQQFAAAAAGRRAERGISGAAAAGPISRSIPAAAAISRAAAVSAATALSGAAIPGTAATAPAPARWRAGPPASRRSRCRRLPVHRLPPPTPIAVTRPRPHASGRRRFRRRRPIRQPRNSPIPRLRPVHRARRTIRPSSRRRPKRSRTAARCLPVSTKSPAAPSNSMRQSAKPCNSARCKSRRGPATRDRRPSPPIPTPLSKSTK